MKNADISVEEEVLLQRFQFDTVLVWHVGDAECGEIRLTLFLGHTAVKLQVGNLYCVIPHPRSVAILIFPCLDWRAFLIQGYGFVNHHSRCAGSYNVSTISY